MIQLPKLPYASDALEPFISKQTMTFHYEKHHATYVKNTNDLISQTPLRDKPLQEIVLTAASDTLYTPLFNNAAQSWNHDFFWKSLTPNSADRVLSDEMKARLTTDFGGLEKFRDAFKKAALSQFGSGWAWLVWDRDNRRLRIETTSNAETPLTHANVKPLLCIDVWEHAYYLDYQNLRSAFVDAVTEHVLNWSFASNNLKEALSDQS